MAKATVKSAPQPPPQRLSNPLSSMAADANPRPNPELYVIQAHFSSLLFLLVSQSPPLNLGKFFLLLHTDSTLHSVVSLMSDFTFNSMHLKKKKVKDLPM